MTLTSGGPKTSYMDEQRVRELAAELTQALAEERAVGLNTRRLLRLLRADIDVALALHAASSDVPVRRRQPGEEPSVHARNLVEQLRLDHPDLAALVQQLANALSNIGL